MELKEKLREILSDVLQTEVGLDVKREGAWDSLNHLRIVMSVEEELGVRMEPDEVAAIGSLSDLARVVQAKL
jgi:acyl carrier protein